MAEEEGPRSFGVFVGQACDGEAHAEASRQLHELVTKLGREAVSRRAVAKGSLAVTFNLECEPTGIVSVAYTIKRKDPEPLRSRGVMFVTKGGNLSVQNPRQQELPLREVANDKPAREMPETNPNVKEV